MTLPPNLIQPGPRGYDRILRGPVESLPPYGFAQIHASLLLPVIDRSTDLVPGGTHRVLDTSVRQYNAAVSVDARLWAEDEGYRKFVTEDARRKIAMEMANSAPIMVTTAGWDMDPQEYRR